MIKEHLQKYQVWLKIIKMKKIRLTESELIKIIETAMDLDKYSQLPNFSSGDENKDMEDTIAEIMGKLKELIDISKSGQKISHELKSKIYKNLDDLNKSFEAIKYRN
jgi:hypothetical protein